MAKAKKYKYLSQSQIDKLNQIEEVKRIRKEEADYQKALKEEKAPSSFGQIKSFLSQKGKSIKPTNTGFIQRLQPAPALSKEQDMVQELFSGEEGGVWGLSDSETRTQIKGMLRTGGGLVNCNDDGETGEIFGFAPKNKPYGFMGGY
jgi:hypothetical protein